MADEQEQGQSSGEAGVEAEAQPLSQEQIDWFMSQVSRWGKVGGPRRKTHKLAAAFEELVGTGKNGILNAAWVLSGDADIQRFRTNGNVVKPEWFLEKSLPTPFGALLDGKAKAKDQGIAFLLGQAREVLNEDPALGVPMAQAIAADLADHGRAADVERLIGMVPEGQRDLVRRSALASAIGAGDVGTAAQILASGVPQGAMFDQRNPRAYIADHYALEGMSDEQRGTLNQATDQAVKSIYEKAGVIVALTPPPSASSLAGYAGDATAAHDEAVHLERTATQAAGRAGRPPVEYPRTAEFVERDLIDAQAALDKATACLEGEDGIDAQRKQALEARDAAREAKRAMDTQIYAAEREARKANLVFAPGVAQPVDAALDAQTAAQRHVEGIQRQITDINDHQNTANDAVRRAREALDYKQARADVAHADGGVAALCFHAALQANNEQRMRTELHNGANMGELQRHINLGDVGDLPPVAQLAIAAAESQNHPAFASAIGGLNLTDADWDAVQNNCRQRGTKDPLILAHLALREPMPDTLLLDHVHALTPLIRDGAFAEDSRPYQAWREFASAKLAKIQNPTDADIALAQAALKAGAITKERLGPRPLGYRIALLGDDGEMEAFLKETARIAGAGVDDTTGVDVDEQIQRPLRANREAWTQKIISMIGCDETEALRAIASLDEVQTPSRTNARARVAEAGAAKHETVLNLPPGVQGQFNGGAGGRPVIDAPRGTYLPGADDLLGDDDDDEPGAPDPGQS
ncbi:MAG: hypothetical protein JKP92_03925 [Alphaproteobacteria bacterium]|nr:hypothetical protein [Alphaproteobacteria bacterium]